MNKKFNLYYIKEEYIEYLRKFDSRVAYNKNQTRPYVGIVCIYKGQKYFVPMSSPKEKHLKLNPNLADIYKIDNTSTFFLTQDGYVYIVYAYGNNDYTTEMDLIIF